MSIFLFIIHCQEVHTLNYLINYETQKKGAINITTNDNKCFLWHHIRHLNPLKIHPEIITKTDRKMVNVDYLDVKFPVSKKDCSKIEQKNKIFNNVFYDENDLVYLVHVSDFEKNLRNVWIYC